MTRIIIVGAGIGGLGAAIALKRAELDVAVYEREPELSAVGAGLTLWLFGAPAVGVHRTDLKQILLDAAERATVRLGTRCVGFEQTPEGVDISFANGRT